MSARSSEQRIAELEGRVRWLETRVEPVFNARFLDAATTTADVLRVRLIGYDDGQSIAGVPEGVVWSAHVDDSGAPVYPAGGDLAWVLEADDGRWVVVEWRSA